MLFHLLCPDFGGFIGNHIMQSIRTGKLANGLVAPLLIRFLNSSPVLFTESSKPEALDNSLNMPTRGRGTTVRLKVDHSCCARLLNSDTYSACNLTETVSSSSMADYAKVLWKYSWRPKWTNRPPRIFYASASRGVPSGIRGPRVTYNFSCRKASNNSETPFSVRPPRVDFCLATASWLRFLGAQSSCLWNGGLQFFCIRGLKRNQTRLTFHPHETFIGWISSFLSLNRPNVFNVSCNSLLLYY